MPQFQQDIGTDLNVNSDTQSATTLDKPAIVVAGFILHEACLAWPAMPEAELAQLAEDIQQNGQIEPIAVSPDGRIIDGRNRIIACQRVGVEPKTAIYDGDPWLLSLSKNRHRRHMSIEQLALVAAALATRALGSNQHEHGFQKPPSIAEAAKTAGVSETSVKAAKIVLKDGSPEEVAAVKAGGAALQPTAKAIRARVRAGQKPAAKKVSDPIDDVAVDIIAKAADGAWRTLPKIAAIVRVADTAAREALKRLGSDVETRRNGALIEYRIQTDAAENGGDLRDLLAAKDREIADLKAKLAERDLEISRLSAALLTHARAA